MEHDLLALEAAMAALARDHQRLLEERRQLMNEWRRQADQELSVLRALRRMLNQQSPDAEPPR